MKMKEKIEKGEGKGEKSMRQPGTDFGQRGESGEKFPKGVAKAESKNGKHEKLDQGVGHGKADKHGTMEGGVGRHEHHMGEHDGHHGEFNHGTQHTKHVCYEHKRVDHVQDEPRPEAIKTLT